MSDASADSAVNHGPTFLPPRKYSDADEFDLGDDFLGEEIDDSAISDMDFDLGDDFLGDLDT